jgi:hypothetical protein
LDRAAQELRPAEYGKPMARAGRPPE